MFSTVYRSRQTTLGRLSAAPGWHRPTSGVGVAGGGVACGGASGEAMLDRELKQGFRLDENQTLNHLNNGSLCESSFILGTYAPGDFTHIKVQTNDATGVNGPI